MPFYHHYRLSLSIRCTLLFDSIYTIIFFYEMCVSGNKGRISIFVHIQQSFILIFFFSTRRVEYNARSNKRKHCSVLSCKVLISFRSCYVR